MTRTQMNTRTLARILVFLVLAGLLAGLAFSSSGQPARAAAGAGGAIPLQGLGLAAQLACVPPENWDLTTRVNSSNRDVNWTFTVAEPQMDVVLEFIFFQDYDREGCPIDCSTGDCQLTETGVGTSPLGTVELTDGVRGARSGIIRQEGTLAQGTYPVTFHFTGLSGSLNIGLLVTTLSPGTDTPTPTQTVTQTPTLTFTPTTTGTPTLTPIMTDTKTPTPSAIPTEPGEPQIGGYFIPVFFYLFSVEGTPTPTPTLTQIPTTTETPTITPTPTSTATQTFTPTTTATPTATTTSPRFGYYIPIYLKTFIP